MKDGALLLGVLIILGGVGWFLFNSTDTAEAPAINSGENENPTQINPPSMDIEIGPDDGTSDLPEVGDEVLVSSFAECVEVGNPVMESYPRQCRHDGVLFVEEIADPDQPVACTQEAKLCPDGSAVGRTGPNCEFAPCPGEEPDSTGSGNSTTCTPESKQVDVCTKQYSPVCGLVEVQCFTTPCNPVPETFSNGCYACAQGNVISYTAGACSE